MTEKRGASEKTCPSCGTLFLCMHDAGCWCNDYRLTPKKLVWLQDTFNGCLCPACLSQHAVPSPGISIHPSPN